MLPGCPSAGADSPAYTKEIKGLGVTRYEAYIADGHIDYHGADNYTAKVPAKYDAVAIAGTFKNEAFKAGLVAHQQGKTDFLTFIKMCAVCGIEKWAIDMGKMTCIITTKQATRF